MITLADNNMNMQIIIESQNNTSDGFESMNSAIEAIQNLVGDLTKSFENFSNAISNAMGDATKSVEDLAQPIESATKELDSIGTASNEAAQQIGEISKSLDGVANNGALNDIGKGLEDISTGASNASQSLSDTSKDLDSVNEAALTTTKSLDDVSKVLDDVGKSSSVAGSEAKENMDNMKTEAESCAESFGSIAKQMDDMFAGMALGAIGAPLVEALKTSSESFGTFDQSMRLVNEEAKLNDSGFKNLESSVLSLSNQTGISADQLAQGLYNVMSTGLTDAAGGMKVLQTAAEGAKAGNADLSDTTKALDSVLGAYGMTANQASHVMDIMFQATNDGQMHFQDLAKSVGASATSAAMAGVSYSELAASEATLTNVGKNAELASQQLNSLIMGIIAPTAGATKEAKALGIEWDASALKAKGLSGMIDEATKATGGNDEKLKKLIPNQRAWQATVALGTTAHQLYTKTLNDMSNATGSTAAALEEYDKGAGDAIEKMKTSIQNAGIALGTAMAPVITAVANAINTLSNAFQSLSPSTQAFIGYAMAIVGGLATLGATFFMARSGLRALAAAFEDTAALNIARDAFEGLGATIKGLSFSGIAAGIESAFGSIGGTLAKAGGSISSFLLGPWRMIGDGVKSVLTILTTSFSTTFTAILNGVEKFALSCIASLERFGTSIKNVMLAIPGLLSKALDGLEAFFVAIVEGFEKIPALLAGLLEKFSVFVAGILDGSITITGAIEALLGPWGILVAVVMAAVGAIIANWDTIKNWAQQHFGGTIPTTWKQLKADAETIWKDIENLFTEVWNNIKKVIQDAWNYIQPTITKGVNEIQSFWKEVWPEIKQVFVEVWDVMKVLIGPAVAAIYTAISAGLGLIKGAWQDAWNLIKDTLKTVWDAIKDIIKTAWDLITGIIKVALDLLTGNFTKAGTDFKNIFINIGTDIANIFKDMAKDAIQWGSDLIQGLIHGIEGAVGGVVNAVSNIANTIKSYLHFSVPDVGPLTDYESWMPDFMNGLANGITSNIGKVQNAVTSVASAMQMPITGAMSSNISNNFAYVGSNSGNSGITINTINVTGNVAKNEKELGQTVAAEIWNQIKKQGKF